MASFEVDEEITSANDCWVKLSQYGVQRRFIDNDLYAAGNKLCQPVLGKKSVVIYDNEDYLHENLNKFRCHVPGCMKYFETLIAYEEHYNTNHRYVCSTCHKRLPSAHLLDLHILETHDYYFAALAEKKPMFQCLVESCNLKFSSPEERRKHCIEDHKFPPDYRYETSLKHDSKKKPDSHTTVTSAKYVPDKFHGFGYNSSRAVYRGGRRRGGLQPFDKKSSRQNKAENEVSMVELEDALPSME